MHIVDAQVHIWGRGKPLIGPRELPFTPTELLTEMDAAGVARAVMVPVSWDPNSAAMALEAAGRLPSRLAVMAPLPLDASASRSRVARWRDQPGLLGLRLLFLSPVSRAWLSDGTADWIWPAAAELGLPVMLLAPGLTRLVHGIAERHPALRLILDHMAVQPGLRDADAFAHLPELEAIAALPNVAVKASAVPAQSSEPYPYRNIHGYLRRIFEAFGPERFFWGSDLTTLSCPYRQCVHLFTEELDWLTGADRLSVMGNGLRQWLGWDAVSAAA